MATGSQSTYAWTLEIRSKLFMKTTTAQQEAQKASENMEAMKVELKTLLKNGKDQGSKQIGSGEHKDHVVYSRM